MTNSTLLSPRQTCEQMHYHPTRGYHGYQTVRNRLRQSGLRSRCPLKGMELKRPTWLIPPHTITPPPPNRSVSFTQPSAKRSLRRLWIRTLPSLNFRLNLDSSESKMFCQVFRLHRRRARAHWSLAILCRRERFADGCVKETDRFGGGGVMVMGGITHVGKTNLKTVVGT
jgi:hypothetical protein